MNNQSIVYKIASIIQMIDKNSENEIEMIVWALISFLMMNDERRDFSIEMMSHCRDFVTLLKFVKMMIEIFSEFLIEMKMRVIVWENFLLLMIHEIIVSLMLDEMLFLLMLDKMIFLSEVIVLSLIDLETMILEI